MAWVTCVLMGLRLSSRVYRGLSSWGFGEWSAAKGLCDELSPTSSLIALPNVWSSMGIAMPNTYAQNHIQHFIGKTHLEITYVVCSDQFPDVRKTFEPQCGDPKRSQSNG